MSSAANLFGALRLNKYVKGKRLLNLNEPSEFAADNTFYFTFILMRLKT